MSDNLDFSDSLKQYLARLKDKMQHSSPLWQFFRLEYEGYSMDEIEALRTLQKVERLPAIYIEFMRSMGNRPRLNLLNSGFHLHKEAVAGAYRSFIKTLIWHRSTIQHVAVPKNAFIFAANHGFLFFRCDQQDDPPVFHYNDNMILFDPDDDFSYKVADRLSDWFLNQMMDPYPFIDHAQRIHEVLTLSEPDRMPIPQEKMRRNRYRVKTTAVNNEFPSIPATEFGEALRKHLRAHFADRMTGEFVGCEDDEIIRVMSEIGIKFLPQIFQQYLGVMGKYDGNILVGGDRGIDNLVLLKRGLRTILKENAEVTVTPLLPKDAVVFLAYQGVEFFWFRAKPQNDDPPVMVYIDEEATFIQVAEHLSHWLWTHIGNPLAILEYVED